MKLVAYTSDLHIDFYMRDAQCSKLLFDKAFGKYFEEIDSKTIIIAGDIGHYPEQNIRFLDILRTKYNLENVITVSGNHTGYRVNDKQRRMFPTGLHKIAYEEDLFSENGIKVLDGNSYDIGGTIIGGSKSWYDGTVYYRMNSGWYNSSNGSLENLWKRTMNDSKYMNLDEFWDIGAEEKDKFKKLSGTCDVMVSHVCPTVTDKFFHEEYRGQIGNAFYSFDFEENIVADERLKYWIYGHTHTINEYDFFGKNIVANPLGYPNEGNPNELRIRHIEL